mgnify:CR=1 FL=1
MLNRKTFFVSFFLRRDRVMKNGTAPIMARISVNGIAKEIYTQCRTAVDKWDPAKGRATGRDRLSYEVNAYIDDFRAKVIEIYRTLQAEGFEGNAIEIKERLKVPASSSYVAGRADALLREATKRGRRTNHAVDLQQVLSSLPLPP